MISFTLPDMTCGHCVGVINQMLIELDPACELEFDLLNHIIKVESSCTHEQLADALTEVGYPPA
ncbi:heavy-metal-associated domain-containing protein [Oceanisphaera sp. KMM 10153]|uniref:heavy-metal-associated domain-containing protein n=1 Tax=Oceanisphaera submarina TaxID=3390193 RepID=UPI003974DF12